MYSSIVSLDKLKAGANCVVCSLLAQNSGRRQLLDLGIIPGTKIEVLGKSPSGDPMSYFIRGTVIALRDSDSSKIIVKVLS